MENQPRKTNKQTNKKQTNKQQQQKKTTSLNGQGQRLRL
jgi:hypothetical protein